MRVYEKLTDPVGLSVFIITLILPVAVGLYAMRRTRSQRAREPPGCEGSTLDRHGLTEPRRL